MILENEKSSKHQFFNIIAKNWLFEPYGACSLLVVTWMHRLETLLIVLYENQWEDTLLQGFPELFSPSVKRRALKHHVFSWLSSLLCITLGEKASACIVSISHISKSSRPLVWGSCVLSRKQIKWPREAPSVILFVCVTKHDCFKRAGRSTDLWADCSQSNISHWHKTNYHLLKLWQV